MTYITLEQLTYKELLRFEQECDGLTLNSDEDRALRELIELAETHPDTDLNITEDSVKTNDGDGGG